MPMATRRVLVAVTHQRDISTPPQLLDQPQSELLAVILDALVGLIEGHTTAKELTPVLTPEICPTHRSGLILQEKPFARPEIRHPFVIPGLLKTPAAHPRH
jgi:hypothetical protein